MDTAYRKAIAALFGSTRPEPGWRLEFFSGQAGSVLLAESVGAALLVAGTKEHVGIGMVFGSMSHYCLADAQCSAVLAVPAGPGASIKIMIMQPPPPATSHWTDSASLIASVARAESFRRRDRLQGRATLGEVA
jgi:hypothetical protein